MSVSRLAVLPDFPEENWPSMDLCAQMLMRYLRRNGAVTVGEERPDFRRGFGRLPLACRAGFNADRLVNRYLTYPLHARRLSGRYDLFHVVDHSYAQLVSVLPARRSGVFVHDLDTFRCLLDPAADPRPGWFRVLARRTLAGLRAARLVFHNSLVVGDQVRAAGLVPAARVVHAPLGVAAEFTLVAPASPPLLWLDALASRPYLLHVGSCIPRKRMDVLLDVAAAVRASRPDVALVKVGGPWTPDQAARLERNGLAGQVVTAAGLTRTELAEVYRQAAVVLLPSDAEGFGLPVIEALACGAVVVASDLPVLREVGQGAAVFCPVADVPGWAAAVGRVLSDPGFPPPRADRLAVAARYTWANHAAIIADAYQNLWGELCAASPG